jgi:hypothetical protein
MGTIASRLAKLEQQQRGADDAPVLGHMAVNFDTGTGPDVVTVPTTGERLTEAAFRRRYPRGMVLAFTDYGDPDDAA